MIADLDVAWNLGVGTEYVVRGASQSSGHPALSGGADVTVGDIYVGSWVSTVDFSDDGDGETDAEIEAYAGWRHTRGPWTVDLGVVAYHYSGQPQGADLDFVEAHGSLARTFGPLTVRASMDYAPTFSGGMGSGRYLELEGDVKLGDGWSLSAALGEQRSDMPGPYRTWALALRRGVGEGLALEFLASDTNRHSYGRAYGPHLSAALTVSF